MRAEQLRAARLNRGWTQNDVACRLGVSQAYVVMLEKGTRPVTAVLGRKLMTLYDLSPSLLATPKSFTPTREDPQDLADQLASLGYPGYAYLHPRAAKKNPGEVLLNALSQESLEPRLAEALPWLLLRYWDMDFSWVVEQAKRFDLQNRLGFVTDLALKVSAANPQTEPRTRKLKELETVLNRSRLARQDDSLSPPQNSVERDWLLQNRPDNARHWGLLSDLRPEHLSYDRDSTPG